MNVIDAMLQSTLDALRKLQADVGAYLPRILAAMLLLILGWAIAKILRRLTIKILRALRFDDFAERIGVEAFLLQGGVRQTAVTIFANLMYWLTIFGVILAVLRILGLEAAGQLLNQVVLYIPRVAVAILLLLVGSLLGRLVKTMTFASLNNLAVEGAGLISLLAYWAVIIFAVSVALEQLSIGGQILVSAFQIAFGAFCLALALAFGLGGRRWAARILDRLWKG